MTDQKKLKKMMAKDMTSSHDKQMTSYQVNTEKSHKSLHQSKKTAKRKNAENPVIHNIQQKTHSSSKKTSFCKDCVTPKKQSLFPASINQSKISDSKNSVSTIFVMYLKFIMTIGQGQ